MNPPRHWEASLNFVCYRPYYTSDENRLLEILPPVSYQGDSGNCTAHAFLCAIEARCRLGRTLPPLPKSIWRLSLTDLLRKLQFLTGKSEGFTYDDMALAFGSRGIGLYVDHEAVGRMDEYPRGAKFSISHVDTYALLPENLWSEVEVPCWRSATGNVLSVVDVVKEIDSRGPVVACFFMDDDFSSWSNGAAIRLVFKGCVIEHGTSLTKEQKICYHSVALTGAGGGGIGVGGVGVGEDMSKMYFVAQNSYGTSWGDYGYFKLDPSCIHRIGIPIF